MQISEAIVSCKLRTHRACSDYLTSVALCQVEEYWEKPFLPETPNSNCLFPPLDSDCRYENCCFDHSERECTIPLLDILSSWLTWLLGWHEAWHQFCKRCRSISVLYNYQRIVLFLTLLVLGVGFIYLQTCDLKVDFMLTSFFQSCNGILLCDAFLVPPTQTHARSKPEHWLSSPQDSAETNGTRICCFKICLSLSLQTRRRSRSSV